MPIRPENRRHYTAAAGWPQIRAKVLARATLDHLCPEVEPSTCCELCCVPNGRVVWRDPVSPQWAVVERTGWKPVKIVLTIAHLNQDPTDNRMVNLLALCQRCHNKIDAPWRQRHAATTSAQRGASNAGDLPPRVVAGSAASPLLDAKGDNK